MQIEIKTLGAPTGERPSWRDARSECGPFDIIGDSHGCADELEQLLNTLGYELVWSMRNGVRHAEVRPPAGRKVVFLGDLVDRGPNVADVLRIAMSVVSADCGYCVRGNHEQKLEHWLAGRRVTISHGLAQTIEQIQREGSDARASFAHFLRSLPSYIWLDGGRLIVSHAGLKARMVGRDSKTIQRFTMYGQSTGETDALGLPIRGDWASKYDGTPAIVYGHTPVRAARWVGNTICIDTGCVFGGRLTALRWPERSMVSVPAARVWYAHV